MIDHNTPKFSNKSKKLSADKYNKIKKDLGSFSKPMSVSSN
jgi:hypothetical protein